MTMLAPYNFLPLYCPSCGTLTRLDSASNPLAGKFKAKQAEVCATCGVMYQLVDKTDLLRAATASGGDMMEYYIVDEDDATEQGKLN
jgi:predicted RNA-binding Zn-ribbon protein involved in translation (DUF1610 family)